MGRNQKVTAIEVKEALSGVPGRKRKEGYITLTVRELAEMFGVTVGTIRSKVKELRIDGEPIIHGSNGLQLIDPEDLTDPIIAEAMAVFASWIIACFKGNVVLAGPIRPLLPQMKRTLKENTTSSERRKLARSCTIVRALLDQVEIEEEISG